MGKYIVELKKNETLYKAATRESDGTAYVCSAIGTPYAEPDLEQVRKEAYEKGRKDVETQVCSYDACKNRQEEYQRGLADAWEAARKIALMDTETSENVTGYFGLFRIMENLTPMQAIEKIRQYEREQDKQARVEYNREEIEDVINTTMKECNVSLDEIAEVLRKMKESANEN